MKLEIGQKVMVIANEACHNFPIGSIVKSSLDTHGDVWFIDDNNRHRYMDEEDFRIINSIDWNAIQEKWKEDSVSYTRTAGETILNGSKIK